LETTQIGLDYARVSGKLNRNKLFQEGTHALGPFHRFIKYPTDLISVEFKSGVNP